MVDGQDGIEGLAMIQQLLSLLLNPITVLELNISVELLWHAEIPCYSLQGQEGRGRQVLREW